MVVIVIISAVKELFIAIFAAINCSNDLEICFLFSKNWRGSIKTWPRFAWIEKTAMAAWWKAEYPQEWLMLTHLTRVSLAIHQFFNLHSVPAQPSHPSLRPFIIACFHPRGIYWGTTGGVVEVDCWVSKCFPKSLSIDCLHNAKTRIWGPKEETIRQLSQNKAIMVYESN